MNLQIISGQSNNITPKELVISIFDCIKCAAATDKGVTIKLSQREVYILSQQIKTIDKLDIRWDPESMPLPFE